MLNWYFNRKRHDGLAICLITNVILQREDTDKNSPTLPRFHTVQLNRTPHMMQESKQVDMVGFGNMG